MHQIELITSIVCPFAQRTRITLAEKSAVYRTKEIDFVDGRFDKPDWFLALTPYATVPVLKMNEDVIYDSDVVNQYIEDVLPEPPLMPGNAAARAMARLWINYSNSKFIRAYYGVIMSQDDARIDKFRKEFHDVLRFMEREGIEKLGINGPYWMGKNFSLVDITFYPFFERFGMLDHYRGFKIPDDCRRLLAWLDAVRDRPSVADTILPDQFHIEAYTHWANGTQGGVTAREMSKVLA